MYTTETGGVIQNTDYTLRESIQNAMEMKNTIQYKFKYQTSAMTSESSLGAARLYP